MKKTVIVYSVILIVLIFVLKFIEYKYFVGHFTAEVYIGIIAISCTIIGIWLGLNFTKKRPQQPGDFINEPAIRELGMSQREMEVLNLIVEGCSNQEIADRLFLSLSTIKTHTSNLFSKLNVSRRTQAVQKAFDLNLVSKN